MSKPVKWLVDGRAGRSTVKIRFGHRDVLIMPADGNRTEVSFEALRDLSEALNEALETINTVADEEWL